MADLAKLVVRLEAQSAQLLTELEKANKRIDRFASQTSKTLQKWTGGLLAAFSARALIQFGNQVIDNQAKLGDLAQQAGVTVESISRLGYAASQSGSDVQSLNSGLGNLSKQAVAAASGSKESAEAFAAMGISAQKADKSIKSTDDLLLEIATSFAAHADGAEKSALAQQLFGKSGKELIPLLNKGAEGIAELTAKADALGITVSTQAQQAADDFNNSMSTLGQVVQGVVGKALTEVLPVVTGFAEKNLEAAGAADRFDKSARVLASGLKLLISAGIIVGEIFDRVGSFIGAAAAALVKVAQGEFGEAYDIIKAHDEDFAASLKESADDLARTWQDTGAAVVKSAEDTANAVNKIPKPTFSLPGSRPDPAEIEKYYKKLNELTETDRERALRSIDEQIAALNKLAAVRRITDEQYAERLAAINEARDEALGITQRELEAEERRQAIFAEGKAVFEATRTPLEQYEQTLVRLNLLLQQGAIDQETYARAVEQAQDELDKSAEKMSDFAKEMRRNVQDILGKSLVDVVKGSAGDILQTFTDMITELVAQALAARLAEKLFGPEDQAGRGGTGGLIGAGINFLGGLFGFGGTRDVGGRGQPGMAYAIGTGAQPEVYVPDQPGTFYPRGEMHGPGGATQNIYVQGLADRHTARQMQIEAARRQRISTARLG